MPPPPTTLPPDVLAVLHAGAGVFHARTARAAGVTANRLSCLVAAGLLVRIGHGVYTSRRLLDAMRPEEAFAVRSRGFVLGCGPGTLASGHSALALHGIAMLGAPPRQPRAVQPDHRSQGSRRLAHGDVTTSHVPPEHRLLVMGTAVVSAVWSGVELLRRLPPDDALVVADSLLHRGFSRADLRNALGQLGRRSGSAAAARSAIERADDGAETPIETLGRKACHEYGIPVPLSNVWVGVDRPVYRVDHLWPSHGVAAEADGQVKYADPVTVARVIAEEKEREYYLRHDIGLDVIRYGWRLAAHDRERLAVRFAHALLSAGRREHPVRWWPRHAA